MKKQNKILKYSIEDGFIVKEPSRGTKASAGIDIYIPRFTDAFEREYDKLTEKLNGRLQHPNPANIFGNSSYRSIDILPHHRILLPTGLRFEIPEGTYLEVANRGSVASKLGLVYGAHIIDEDYRGMVFLNLINTSDTSITLEPGTKIAQLIHKEYIQSILVQVENVSLETERGEGALGHTNKRNQE